MEPSTQPTRSLIINGVEIGAFVKLRFQSQLDLESPRRQAALAGITYPEATGQVWAKRIEAMSGSVDRVLDATLSILTADSAHLSDPDHEAFWAAAKAEVANLIGQYSQGLYGSLEQRAETSPHGGGAVKLTISESAGQRSANLMNRFGRRVEEIRLESRLKRDKRTDEDAMFMRAALDEARKCNSESQDPPKPKVAAVLVRDGKEIGRAHRGELKAGEHAEYTLLGRKLANVDVAGATLYVTLEPCTKRGEGKTPCAQWVRDRKVARVVVAALDPNREILGQGIISLHEAGIDVALAPKAEMDAGADLIYDFRRYHREEAPRLAAKAEAQNTWRARTLAAAVFAAIVGLAGGLGLQAVRLRAVEVATTQRELNQAQRERLIGALRTLTLREVQVLLVQDGEAHIFGDQLVAIFQSAGWKVVTTTEMWRSGVGLIIEFHGESHEGSARELQAALASAGIATGIQPAPDQVADADPHVCLFVGVRPPPR